MQMLDRPVVDLSGRRDGEQALAHAAELPRARRCLTRKATLGTSGRPTFVKR
jgi:hypothetical protein